MREKSWKLSKSIPWVGCSTLLANLKLLHYLSLHLPHVNAYLISWTSLLVCNHKTLRLTSSTNLNLRTISQKKKKLILWSRCLQVPILSNDCLLGAPLLHTFPHADFFTSLMFALLSTPILNFWGINSVFRQFSRYNIR